MLTAKQLDARKQGIGASEASIVMGASKFKTPYQLWREKTGKDIVPELDTPEIIWGHLLEDAIGKRYCMLKDVKVQRDNRSLKHKDYPHILCHLDRRIVRQEKFIEIKTANWFAFNSENWGEEESDNVPEEYVWQVQQQLAITGYQEADLVVFPKGSRDIKIYTIKRDEELISILIERINHFWNYHVLQDIAPALTNRDDVLIKYPHNIGTWGYVEPDKMNMLVEYKALNQQIASLMMQKEELAKSITESIGDNDGLLMPDDSIVCTWKLQKDSVKRCVCGHETIRKGSRTLRVK